MTPERCAVIRRAAARAVTNCDLTIVVSGVMNSSTVSPMAFLPLPYSCGDGPTALKTMSTPPASFATAST